MKLVTQSLGIEKHDETFSSRFVEGKICKITPDSTSVGDDLYLGAVDAACGFCVL